MRNQGFFQLRVRPEQLAYAHQLVAHSLAHHTVPNIWDGHDKDTATLRLTGSLGEVLFADVYGLPRPARAFGAADGQDWGQDFELVLVPGRRPARVDLKTMLRKSNRFYADYVLNIPANQLRRPDSRTDCYFHITLHQTPDGGTIASFVGYVGKTEIETGAVGTLWPAGSARTRRDGSQFRFTHDTYEVDFGDLRTPPPPALEADWEEYKRLTIRPKT